MKKLRLKESELVNLIKGVINEEGLIGPKTKAIQDWLDNFNDHCSCPPPYAPCGCGSAVPPSGINEVVWEQIQVAETKREVERILKVSGREREDYDSTYEINEEDPGREYPTITHDEFMDGIEKYCNKNTSGCPRRCKSDKEVMNLINKWCKSL